MNDLQDALLAWARTHGRQFAFRETADPYRVLVAETMAQQTQVARIVPALEAFLTRFPSVEALAEASVADVLVAWRGLGYNRRALNLQRAARAVVAEHGGRFPHETAALERLPGVGPYTARAIAVFAFGQRLGPVDTNVRRVLTRVAGRTMPARELQARSDELAAPDPRAWINALMDLGATVCKPARPDCPACPLTAWCLARGSQAPVGERRRRTTRPGPPTPFSASTRWLRGRILDRVRDAAADDWATFDEALGSHPPAAVEAMLGVLAREGLLECHPTSAALARLPR